MNKLFELIKKNFKLLLRARISALIIFVGPLLLVSLLGLSYSQSSTFTLSASVYSQSYSELSESLITKMTNQNFRIIREESSDACIGALRRGDSQSCIIFPPAMVINPAAPSEVTVYVDYSQVNLVWLMLDVMSARVSERSEEISTDKTEDILGRMWFIEEKLRESKAKLSEIRASGQSVKESSNAMVGGFEQLDISVDFSGLDVEMSKDNAQEVAFILTDINAQAAGLINSTKFAISSIESSVAIVESSVNSSGLVGELQDIDSAADDIQDAVDDLMLDVDLLVTNASANIDRIKGSLGLISTRLADTKGKISDVKKQRDTLMPEFDSISTQIDSLVANINSVQQMLDESLSKITELKGQSVAGIITPITTRIEPVATQKTHFNSLFPTLLTLIIMITGILLGATLLIVEKKSKAFFRNNITPTSYFSFSIANYFTSLFIVLLQLLLFVSVSAFFFETEVLSSIWLILLLVFLISSVFIFIGMFVGFLFRTEETVNLAAITLVAAFLLFSGTVIPLESLPSYIKDIAVFNPFVIGELALKQAVIFEMGFAKISDALIMLSSYAVGVFAVLLILQSALRRMALVSFHRMNTGITPVNDKKASARISDEPKDINELAVKKDIKN